VRVFTKSEEEETEEETETETGSEGWMGTEKQAQGAEVEGGSRGRRRVKSEGRPRLVMGDRDWRLLRLVSEQRFATQGQAVRLLAAAGRTVDEVSRKAAKPAPKGGTVSAERRVGQLVAAEVLERRPTFETTTALVVGKVGQDLLVGAGGQVLPRLGDLAWKSYAHDLVVVDVRLQLEAMGATGWRSERQLWAEAGRSGRTPDGIATVNGRTYALEVELTPKSNARQVEVLVAHAKALEAARWGRSLWIVRDVEGHGADGKDVATAWHFSALKLAKADKEGGPLVDRWAPSLRVTTLAQLAAGRCRWVNADTGKVEWRGL
jgi:hypothetical protein